MACKNCGRDIRIHGRGLCSACYSRLMRRGTVTRVNAVNDGKRCSVDGCTDRAKAKGMCIPHYSKAQHPIRNTWKLLRSREAGSYPPSWDDFDAFLSDVGERPSTKHQLRRLDPAKPYSHDNVHWQAPVYAGSNDPDYHGPYSKAWNLKKYGLTVEEYERRLADQGGVCAICEKPEKSNGSHGNGPRALTVDHCHETEANGTIHDAVRGLLCNRCNRLLGLARDDTDLLRKLIAYLDRHRQKSA